MPAEILFPNGIPMPPEPKAPSLTDGLYPLLAVGAAVALGYWFLSPKTAKAASASPPVGPAVPGSDTLYVDELGFQHFRPKVAKRVTSLLSTYTPSTPSVGDERLIQITDSGSILMGGSALALAGAAVQMKDAGGRQLFVVLVDKSMGDSKPPTSTYMRLATVPDIEKYASPGGSYAVLYTTPADVMVSTDSKDMSSLASSRNLDDTAMNWLNMLGGGAAIPVTPWFPTVPMTPDEPTPPPMPMPPTDVAPTVPGGMS